MKKMLKNIAQRLGYSLIPDWQMDRLHGEQHLARLLKYLQTDLVLDVGANAGQFRGMLRRLGYAGQIVSFEPNPALATKLAELSKSDRHWTVDGRALGAAAGTAQFHIMADSEFSSFHAPRHDDIQQFSQQNSIRQSVAVEVTTLDAVLPELVRKFSARSVYVKLDTQGHDLEVLKGCIHSAAHIAGLQTEASVRPIYEGAPGYQEVINYLTERSFVMTGMFPNNGGHFPLLIEFDCHMIARDRIGRHDGGTRGAA